MLSETVLNTINDQIHHELHSAYLYLSMSAYFESLSLPGFASWMRNQAQEEVNHAMKFFDYVNDRSGRVRLKAIEQPEADFDSPLAVFKQALAHEQKISSLINSIYGMAVDERDYATQVMLNWFVEEQVEEEKSAQEIVDKLELIGSQRSLLLLLDRELAQRRPE